MIEKKKILITYFVLIKIGKKKVNKKKDSLSNIDEPKKRLNFFFVVDKISKLFLLEKKTHKQNVFFF